LTISAWLCAAAHISADWPELFFRVHVGAGFDEHFGRLDLAAARGRHDRSFAFGIPGVGIGPGLEQHVEDGRRADNGGLGRGRRAELVRPADIGARAHQRAYELDVAVCRRPHDGRRPVRGRRVRVAPLRQHPQHGRAVALLRRVDQRSAFGRASADRPLGGGRDGNPRNPNRHEPRASRHELPPHPPCHGRPEGPHYISHR